MIDSRATHQIQLFANPKKKAPLGERGEPEKVSDVNRSLIQVEESY